MAPCWRGGAQFLVVTLWMLQCCGESARTSAGRPLPMSHERVKRGWVWNQFFVVEEYTGTEPLYVGKSGTTIAFYRERLQAVLERSLQSTSCRPQTALSIYTHRAWMMQEGRAAFSSRNIMPYVRRSKVEKISTAL
ncbi:hypothetical protein DNTS_016346 [Danionella cerebrum]|uniref:Uncharacterized protein n=1 Tax=Danionella cerebrum TaxID=2873325 RepID=A0A553MZE7_9TELE|nr:hypothetical protein DNTS_016346 [Danionella translucida]